MKKLYIFLFTIALLGAFPVTASAENVILSSGYTEDGIYYEVYGDRDVNIQRSNESIFVTRYVTFSGNITPNPTLEWSEFIKGFQYAGTLYYTASVYSKSTHTTTVTYEGTLYLQD